jgi:tetratricopeptide (TPR) repeat protein
VNDPAADATQDAAFAEPDTGLHVVACREDRLGARLCALLNGMRVAEALRVPFRFAWPPSTDAFAAEIDDVEAVLDRDFVRATRVDPAAYEAVLQEDALTSPAARSATFALHSRDGRPWMLRIANAYGAIGPGALGTLSDALPARRIADAQARLRRIGMADVVERLPLNAAVAAAIAAFAEGAARPVAALHLRRGDVLARGVAGDDKFLSERFAPCALFEGAARLYCGEDFSLRVFSEDAAVRSRLVADLADLDAAAATPPAGLAPIQAAAVDLLTMARSTVILGTRSAFSQTAALIGGAAFVDVNRALPLEAQALLLDRELRGPARDPLETAATRRRAAIVAHRLGVATARGGAPAVAAAVGRRAADAYPDDAVFGLAHGVAALKARRPREALARCDRLLAARPREVGALSLAARAARQAGDLDAAAAYADRAAERAPNDGGVALLRLEILSTRLSPEAHAAAVAAVRERLDRGDMTMTPKARARFAAFLTPTAPPDAPVPDAPVPDADGADANPEDPGAGGVT